MLDATPNPKPSKESKESEAPVPKAKFSREFHKVVWLPLSALCNKWSQSQRTFNEKHAEKIQNEFDPDLFGVLQVTLPDGRGRHHIVDGQHRAEAARRAWGNDQRVPCQVLDASDPVRAAQLFYKQNSQRRGVTAIDKFLVQVTGKSEPHVAVNAIVEELGYKIANGPSPHNIRAVDSLMKVYVKFGGDVLSQSLSCINQCFGKDQHAMSAQLILGFGYLLGENSDTVERKRLVERVEKKFTARRLIARADGISETAHMSKGAAVRHLLLEVYNSYRRSGRIGSNGKEARDLE